VRYVTAPARERVDLGASTPIGVAESYTVTTTRYERGEDAPLTENRVDILVKDCRSLTAASTEVANPPA
jgi:hypothetical protein